jgi:hypothetical protein
MELVKQQRARADQVILAIESINLRYSAIQPTAAFARCIDFPSTLSCSAARLSHDLIGHHANPNRAATLTHLSHQI